MDSRRKLSLATSKEIKLNKITMEKNIRDAIKDNKEKKEIKSTD